MFYATQSINMEKFVLLLMMVAASAANAQESASQQGSGSSSQSDGAETALADAPCPADHPDCYSSSSSDVGQAVTTQAQQVAKKGEFPCYGRVSVSDKYTGQLTVGGDTPKGVVGGACGDPIDRRLAHSGNDFPQGVVANVTYGNAFATPFLAQAALTSALSAAGGGDPNKAPWYDADPDRQREHALVVDAATKQAEAMLAFTSGNKTGFAIIGKAPETAQLSDDEGGTANKESRNHNGIDAQRPGSSNSTYLVEVGFLDGTGPNSKIQGNVMAYHCTVPYTDDNTLLSNVLGNMGQAAYNDSHDLKHIDCVRAGVMVNQGGKWVFQATVGKDRGGLTASTDVSVQVGGRTTLDAGANTAHYDDFNTGNPHDTFSGYYAGASVRLLSKFLGKGPLSFNTDADHVSGLPNCGAAAPATVADGCAVTYTNLKGGIQWYLLGGKPGSTYAQRLILNLGIQKAVIGTDPLTQQVSLPSSAAKPGLSAGITYTFGRKPSTVQPQQ